MTNKLSADFFNDPIEKPSFISVNDQVNDSDINNSYMRYMQIQQQQQQ
ncbi:hypothetical protein SAMN05421847_0681 [Halpernia humi]|uniref:Uncharacterized protein n=1 Tax=Halpernia humi TaxID=493375 RepID=A0A1H5U5X4_9FLAO|nr:hypothetical protein [Halpernia humi]SEF70505.1 hypothetical protein SAMN05421847_0681 [Halpernia humi]